MHNWKNINNEFVKPPIKMKNLYRCEECNLIKDESLISGNSTYWLLQMNGRYKFVSGKEIACSEIKFRSLIL